MFALSFRQRPDRARGQVKAPSLVGVWDNSLFFHDGRFDKIEHDTDRDFYLDPQGAKEYGLIDEILEKPSKANAALNGKVS